MTAIPKTAAVMTPAVSGPPLAPTPIAMMDSPSAMRTISP